MFIEDKKVFWIKEHPYRISENWCWGSCRALNIHLQLITPHLCSSNRPEVRSGHTDTQVSSSDPNNFRPIAAVPAVKIFERAVHKQLYKHLKTHKLQYYPLIVWLSTWSLKCNLSFGCIGLHIKEHGLNFTHRRYPLLERSKAFDLIVITYSETEIHWHSRLRFTWFENYLSGRTQTACINVLIQKK